jgi:hypothetical protein
MSSFLSNKVVRLLLSFSVSVWMAGGCLFGCSNAVGASHQVQDSVETVVAAESCHAERSHDCCSGNKTQKQSVKNSKQPEGLRSLAPVPRGMMKDCPLVANSTAATSKSSTYLPDRGRDPVTYLTHFERQTQEVDNTPLVPFLPNRGPTHLRCCVFLI